MQRVVKFLIVFCLICNSVNTYASNIPTLNDMLNSSMHDTVRCRKLNTLIEEESESAVWLSYNKVMMEICLNHLKSNKLPLTEREIYLRFLAASYNNSGYGYMEQGEIKKSLRLYNVALKMYSSLVKAYKKYDDKINLATSYNNLAYMYQDKGDVALALELYTKALKQREELNDYFGVGECYVNLGSMYLDQGLLDKTVDCYKKSLFYYSKANDKKGIALATNNIGGYFQQKNLIDSSSFYFNKGLLLYSEINDSTGMSYAYNNLALNFQKTGRFKEALEYYTKAEVINRARSELPRLAPVLNNHAGVLFEMEKYDEALIIAKQSYDIAQLLGFPLLLKNASFTLSKIYSAKGQWKEAYEMELQNKTLSDSLSNEKNRKLSIQKSFQYEYDKKAAADSIKATEERKVFDAQLKQEKTQRFALYGGLILVIAFSAFVYNRFKITQKQKAIIEKQKHEVDSAYELLHEKNKEVMDSIRYAARIQRSLITSEKYIALQFRRLTD